jgi:hypothetical protein
MAQEERELSRAEINRDVLRGVSFLGTLSRSPDIRRILADRGYTVEEHQTGWRNLLEVMGWKPDQSEFVGVSAIEQERAMAELDNWDGPNFSIARAVLRRLHPDQEAYIFENLNAAQGAAAVGSVKTYLNRVGALRNGTDPSRAALREEDRAAVVSLETRKVAGVELEAHLAALVETAMTAAPIASEPPVGGPDEYQQAARRLHAWLADWRETARVVVTRGDYQIRLGLINRRVRSASDAEEELETTEED